MASNDAEMLNYYRSVRAVGINVLRSPIINSSKVRQREKIENVVVVTLGSRRHNPGFVKSYQSERLISGIKAIDFQRRVGASREIGAPAMLNSAILLQSIYGD